MQKKLYVLPAMFIVRGKVIINVTRICASVEIQRLQCSAMQAQLSAKELQVAFSINYATPTLNGPQVRADIVFSCVDRNASRPQAIQGFYNEFYSIFQGAQMLKSTRAPQKVVRFRRKIDNIIYISRLEFYALSESIDVDHFWPMDII
jgi:hypothetical protein